MASDTGDDVAGWAVLVARDGARTGVREAALIPPEAVPQTGNHRLSPSFVAEPQ
jgi:hypothetical protein